MPAAEVTVQRLRLTARQAVPGLLPTVEDALRLSSKPAALLNRIVLVRRLRLRASAGASAQAVAAQLERAWQQLAARALPMEQAGDTAEAVWASSLAAARQMLLRRWLRGEPTEAWFWQRLLPAHVQGGRPDRAVALMLADDEAPASAASVVEARKQAQQLRALLSLIAEHGMTAPFIEALGDAQALRLLDRIETTREAATRVQQRPRTAPPAPRAETPRARLLACIAAATMAREAPAAGHPSARLSEPVPAPARAQDRPTTRDRPAIAPPRVPEARAAAAPAVRPLMPAAADAALDQGLSSPWSGLWLLLPLLLRHGLDDADDPLAAWAGAMRAASRHLRIPGDDLIHTALAGLDLPAAPDPHWLRTARLAAVHDARLPLLRLARRHGAAWVSPERIDVEFPPASLDLRIRRAGFDIDPGFVPWLGRIVHFHYPS